MATPGPSQGSLRITEVFLSIQGESNTAGWPTVFVRLTGCPLRCGYCDTSYAFTGGETLAIEEVVDQVAAFDTHHVTVTGGEPLAQPRVHALLTALCDHGHSVSLETSGALSIAGLDPRVVVVLDLKTPGSGESERNHWANIPLLRPQDQVKAVICDEADYRWTLERIREHDLTRRCDVLISPAWGRIEPRRLAEWVLRDRLPVRFQVQLHKVLWGDERGR